MKPWKVIEIGEERLTLGDDWEHQPSGQHEVELWEDGKQEDKRAGGNLKSQAK